MKDVRHFMETAVTLRAPMRADPGLGDNWLEAKKDCDVRADAAKEARKNAPILFFHPESESYFVGTDADRDIEVSEVTGDPEHTKRAEEQGVTL